MENIRSNFLFGFRGCNAPQYFIGMMGKANRVIKAGILVCY